MAGTNGNVLQIYNSGTDGNNPSAGNLAYGELAINYNNEKLYYKNSGDAVRALPLSYLYGITSDVQTQLDAKAATSRKSSSW